MDPVTRKAFWLLADVGKSPDGEKWIDLFEAIRSSAAIYGLGVEDAADVWATREAVRSMKRHLPGQ